MSSVSPWAFGLDDDANVVPLMQAGVDQRSASEQRLREAGARLLPTVANYRDGKWQYPPVAAMLHDQGRLHRHVQALVDLAVGQHWAGVTIDYEELRATDREAFTTFVQALADALHSRGLDLSVDVFAKTTDQGYDERNQAQDYAAIGAVADEVRLMTYDYHWSTSAPGPIAPSDWVTSVLDYARSRIPADKILLGVPLYGYDWSGGVGRPMSWAEIYDLAREQHATVQWDQSSQSPWFTYTDASGAAHQVWFENAYSSDTKFQLARRHGIRGIFLWMFGREDALIWNRLHDTENRCTTT